MNIPGYSGIFREYVGGVEEGKKFDNIGVGAGIFELVRRSVIWGGC